MSPFPRPTAESRSICVLRSRFRDTDAMGIVHHAAYLEYFEAGRVEYLRRRGAGYLEWTQKGIHLPVAETHVRYRAPARFDERLALETVLTDLARATMRFEYRLHRHVPDGETIAEGWTLHVCVGETLRPRRIPPELATLLCGAETHERPIDQT